MQCDDGPGFRRDLDRCLISHADHVGGPNKGPSEFNHHLAGWALIGVGLLALLSIVYPNLGSVRYFWPALFLVMGLFLLAWSDAEIWPRGNMSWTWLLHHDHEAGQHKTYALLLMAIGFVEYLRAHGSLNHFCRAWAFPILAVVGAALLLIHDHTAGEGGGSPEARAYLINPALDPDGKPPTPHAPNPMPGMDALASEVVVPLVTKAGVRWHGWHAFRRGLATNLHQLGVSDKTIERILRHSNVAVTQGCYIKTVDREVTSAMQQFEHSLDYAPNMHLSGMPRERLM